MREETTHRIIETNTTTINERVHQGRTGDKQSKRKRENDPPSDPRPS